MTKTNIWEKIYEDIPLEKIPWRSAPATWFYEFVDGGTIPANAVLELGCGTGEKAIYLAKRGFDVVGIDISQTAIKHARKTTRIEGIEGIKKKILRRC